MSVTLGFDVYDTLIDTHGVVVMLNKMVGDEALGFSRVWRALLIESSPEI